MIEGVLINKLKNHSDDRGFFREVFRFPVNFANIPIEQISHSFVKEGIIKAWHGHVYQHQWNYVVIGHIKVVLIDKQKESVSFNKMIEFVAGENDNPIAYYFPPGVLHGYQCIKGPLQIIYITSGVYDLKDEIRIAPNEVEALYKWE